MSTHTKHPEHATSSPMNHAQMNHEEMGHDAHDPDPHAGHAEDHRGHSAHTDHSGHELMFRNRFWVCLALSIPVLLYSPTLQEWLHFSMPTFPGSPWITPIFAIVVFVYGGLPFLQMAMPELRNKQPGMMTLISLAISVAFVYSIAALFLPNSMSFFWELVTLIDIMLLGHWIEMRSVRQASGALGELAKLMPDTAERIRKDGSVEQVASSALQGGDLLLVRPGASVPADGEITEGESDVNEAMITGESQPVRKGPGDRVIAGTINSDGSLRIRVTATGDATALAGIMRLVEEAQQSKSNTQILADRAAGWLFYLAIAVATLTAIGWTIGVGFGVEVIARVVTVLVIACPHALGLAVPLVVAISTSLAARNGILVRNRLALEEARQIDIVIFDKTGTLTKGEFGVVALEVSTDWTEDEALALAIALEGDSEHTIARGIRAAAAERRLTTHTPSQPGGLLGAPAREEQRSPSPMSGRVEEGYGRLQRNLTLPAVTNFEAIKGRGVRAQSNGHTVYIGGPRLLELLEISPSGAMIDFAERAGVKGQTVVYLVQDQQVVAAFALADVVRPESHAAVKQLHDMGIEVAMLTGDSAAVARAVAEELGIDTYFAEVLPEHKDQKVLELQKQGKRVAMVGDGVNDAPALTRADVGIAIGSGTDVAVESADIILVRSNPLDIVKIVRLSRASYSKMIQNLWWAAGYNIVALPLAAGVLAPIGILLSPAVGALLMSISTVVVALNAQLLRRAQLAG